MPRHPCERSRSVLVRGKVVSHVVYPLSLGMLTHSVLERANLKALKGPMCQTLQNLMAGKLIANNVIA